MRAIPAPCRPAALPTQEVVPWECGNIDTWVSTLIARDVCIGTKGTFGSCASSRMESLEGSTRRERGYFAGLRYSTQRTRVRIQTVPACSYCRRVHAVGEERKARKEPRRREHSWSAGSPTWKAKKIKPTRAVVCVAHNKANQIRDQRCLGLIFIFGHTNHWGDIIFFEILSQKRDAPARRGFSGDAHSAQLEGEEASTHHSAAGRRARSSLERYIGWSAHAQPPQAADEQLQQQQQS